MKQFLLIVFALVITATISVGQTTAQKPTPPRPEIQRLDAPDLAEAQRQAVEARTAAETAAARYETAQQRVLTVLYRVMAEMKLSPKEWQVKQDQSGIYLERIKTEATPAQPTKP